MWGLADALPLQLTVNNSLQKVGEAPTFTLIGAPPGATVLWSSYKDGAATGEFNTSYGQLVESNGTARLTGGNWAEGDIGLWTKEVLIQDAAGGNNRAMIQFRVVPATTSSATTPPTAAPISASGGDWFSEPLFEIAGFEVTPVVALIGFGALYFLTKKR
ncbi:MAG: hypothetical protein ACKVZH_06770 [Blastocatellia bacterium]